VVEVGAERVGGDLAGASDVDGLDGAGVEEFVELGAADAQGVGGFADGVDEAVGCGGGERGGASFRWSGRVVRPRGRPWRVWLYARRRVRADGRPVRTRTIGQPGSGGGSRAAQRPRRTWAARPASAYCWSRV